MDANAPLISVVTPFYNTEEYLSECIESVLQQTYSNWEYVLLNNYSTDGSVQIAEHYAKLHPDRIRLEHNSVFLSQVQNYNQVLRFISPKSKYCKFVQADDMLFPQCLELMVDTAERDSSIGVVGSYGLEGYTVEFDGLPYPSPMVDGREVCRLLFLDDLYLFGSPTQLLIRSDLVLGRTPFFNESYYPFEDAVVILELLEHCNFGFVHQVLTFSRRDDRSVMRSLLALDCLIATRLLLLREFGQRFLEPEEYQVQLKRKERTYAHLLVDAMVALRGKSFWEFHEAMRKRMGYTFKSWRTWWLFFVGLCDVLLNPKRSWRLFYDGLRRSKQ
jgi:glycosyltransferase involved in cell wall biosynthesis